MSQEDRKVRRLSDLFKVFGAIPFGQWAGQPVFQYKRGHELRMPYRCQGDRATIQREVPIMRKDGKTPDRRRKPLIVVLPNYEWGYQTDKGALDSRWVIARWLAPTDKAIWEASDHGKVLEWPREGFWFCFQPTRDGYVPTEEWTSQFIIPTIRTQFEMTYQQHYEAIEDREAKKEEDYRKLVVDIYDDNSIKVPHLPGKRGGSISFPATKFN